jgi:hypothetical protein
MKRFNSVLLLAVATLFVSQTSFALSKTQELQIEVLVLDATMDLAKMGAAGGRFAAKEISPGWEAMPPGAPNADTVYVEKVSSAADRAALAYCPTCDALQWVSKAYTPLLEEVLLGGWASQTYGWQLTREAANKLAQSAHPSTWGPDLIWDKTTEVARDAIKRGAFEEEIGTAAAQASWSYVLKITDQIGDAVRAKISEEYLADEFDAKQVLASLKSSIDSNEFKQGLPEAQQFYKDFLTNLEQQMKDQHLID